MSRSTAAYEFEFAILHWALGFGHGCGFVVALSSGGYPVQVLDGPGSASNGPAGVDAPRWLAFDPFDLPEYALLSWRAMPREIMERLVGALPPVDAPRGHAAHRRVPVPLCAFPETWTVVL